MIHQPLGGAQGQATDIAIQAKQILLLKEKLNHILVRHTGQPYDKIEKDTDRDRYMSSEEAKDYGIVDNVVMERGKVYDIGKHEELVERCDIYKTLWYQQNRHLDPEGKYAHDY